MSRVVEQATGPDPVTIKAYLAIGIRLITGTALDFEQLPEPWAESLRTGIRPAIVDHLTSETTP
jgi:hypothetical protein